MNKVHIVTCLNVSGSEAGTAMTDLVTRITLTGCLKICFMLVPGHVGVNVKERAAGLAVMATVGDRQAMDRTDILNALRRLVAFKDSGEDFDSASANRLLEHNV